MIIGPFLFDGLDPICFW